MDKNYILVPNKIYKPKLGQIMTYLILVASELGQIMTRYDFLEARIVSLSNVRTDSNFTWFYFW